MSGGYSKDANSIYQYNKKIKNADPATFTVVKRRGFAYDKNYLYFGDKKVKIDYKTFDINFDKRLYQDKDYTYTFTGNRKIIKTRKK